MLKHTFQVIVGMDLCHRGNMGSIGRQLPEFLITQLFKKLCVSAISRLRREGARVHASPYAGY
ncbi:hypothetical protein KSF_032900 [Reticulibacter mediterranei]|uniref:Uncharacterized protein n=1 Tax=Reticulibacter mediterranei TaxID=2778369 RepID=A0A8J3N3K8_9CHLR|nr:hypothetical protein KSF_032900 [Reticulibacter mediterranei]